MDSDELLRTLTAEGIQARRLQSGVVSCEIAGDKAVELWKQLRLRTSATGAYPLIVGNPSEVRPFEGACNPSKRSPEATVAVSAWVEARFQELADDLSEENSESVLPRGPWPIETKRAIDYHCITSTDGARYRTNVALVLVPAFDHADVPLVIPFGGWNDCPAPQVHRSFFKYWHERYGAELISLSTDIVEMFVARPPTSAESALALAREQYAYCGDIVDQGTQTIDALAAEILNQPRWFFWWD